MKRATTRRTENNKLVFTHHGHACTVRRSHRRARGHQTSGAVATKAHANFVERLLGSLLPHLGLGEIV
ncbi:MAG: hypothetical protein DME97_18690 [Verrucomicrobia bacterium]|nr:MAG: hypothetical protein DME97_18690 [Verrucomicrobiota bacterium]